MTELSIDTRKRALRVRLQLAGEAEPIEIHVNKYRLTQRGDRAALTIVDAAASRPWLTEALRQFVVGQSFPVPGKAAAFLKLLT